MSGVQGCHIHVNTVASNCYVVSPRQTPTRLLGRHASGQIKAVFPRSDALCDNDRASQNGVSHETFCGIVVPIHAQPESGDSNPTRAVPSPDAVRMRSSGIGGNPDRPLAVRDDSLPTMCGDIHLRSDSHEVADSRESSAGGRLKRICVTSRAR